MSKDLCRMELDVRGRKGRGRKGGRGKEAYYLGVRAGERVRARLSNTSPCLPPSPSFAGAYASVHAHILQRVSEVATQEGEGVCTQSINISKLEKY